MKQTERELAVPVLLVSTPSPHADQIEQSLRVKGLSVLRADNICFAEMYAETQRFEAAIYDQSLSAEEQVSLARVMRVRWPWMRLIRWVPGNRAVVEDEVFDWSVSSESQLDACIERWLAM